MLQYNSCLYHSQQTCSCGWPTCTIYVQTQTMANCNLVIQYVCSCTVCIQYSYTVCWTFKIYKYNKLRMHQLTKFQSSKRHCLHDGKTICFPSATAVRWGLMCKCCIESTLSTVLPPSECFWSIARNGFIAIQTTSGERITLTSGLYFQHEVYY